MSLFPEIEPYDQGYLSVAGHEIYYEQVGNPEGLPAVFLHGGPGGGAEAYHRRFFDPERYRVLLFDQRGCGRSRPHAELKDNTTQNLVADIERLRELLGVSQWVVFGGSWGSTLALAYAETHPDKVSGLILRGIFLCREQDFDWFYRGGTARLFPDYWEEFIAQMPDVPKDKLIETYYDALTCDDELKRMAAAKAWSVWEGRTATLCGNDAVEAHFAKPEVALALARIEAHYFVNQCFMQPNQLLDQSDRLRGVPGVIVHGRYDVICPVDQAWALHKAWPEAELTIIPDAGHSASEPGITAALIQATNDFAKRFR